MMNTFKQYYRTHVQDQVVDGLIETFGIRAAMSILHDTRTTMLLEADDYTKAEGPPKIKNSKKDLIATLSSMHKEIQDETDPDKRSGLQRTYNLTFRYAKRYNITQADVDNYQPDSKADSASGSTGAGGSSSGSKGYTGYEHGTYDSDNPYSKADAERNRKDMDDWFNNYNQKTAQNAADKYGIPVEVWKTYDDIIRGYVGLKIPKTSTGGGGIFDQMDSTGHSIDQMAFDRWVGKYKTSAEDWIKRDFPNIPIAVKRHIMTGEELLQTWNWFANNYKDTNGNEFNGHEETHIQELPLAGERTDEWRNKQRTSPPPGADPEEEPEPSRAADPDPETQPGSDRQPSDEETSILNDIHRLLKRGKAAGGRIRNYLPLAGVYEPDGNPRDQQISTDTETLLDLVNMLRSLGKSMHKHK